MRLSDYQVWTKTTAIYPSVGTCNQEELSYLSLGLVSEAGEVGGKVKKYIRDGIFVPGAIAAELGDVAWYFARLCDTIGYSAEDILRLNHAKLMSRKEMGVLSGSGDTR